MARWRQNQLIDPIARIADQQTGGKGRQGRKWLSESGKSLTFSVAYPFDKTIGELSGFSLACGLAVIKGIAKALNISLSDLKLRGLALKWPNDIFINGNKLAGILVEGGQINPQNSTWIVIGVGINLTPITATTSEIGQPIASLDQLGPITDRDVLWLAIIDEIGNALEEFSKVGFSSFVTEWNDWHAFNQRSCNIIENGKIISEGICEGANSSGQLLLRNSKEIESIVSGDLSLRGT